LPRTPKILTVAAALALVALAGLAVAPAPGASPRHLDRALEAQRALATERPADADVHNDLGNLLALAGDRRGAEEAYRRALELEPDRPGTRFNYGLLLADTDRRVAALRQFREVVDLDPGHAWAHYQIGSLYDSWGLDGLARRAYTRAFRLDPTLADARVNPDVVGNRQVTRAMLRAWSEGIHGSRAPRAYSDAGRIAGLMIDYPATAPTAEDPTEWAEIPGSEPGGGFARLVEPGTSPGAETYPPDQDDLERRDPSLDEGDELAESSPETGRTRTLTIDDLRSSGSINQAAPSGGARPGAVRPSPRTRTLTPRGGRFTPGMDSTGRLEPVLVPPSATFPTIAG
jgi:hypothetical protein